MDVNIHILFASYVGYKFAKKTKFRRWDKIDFVTGIPTLKEVEVSEVPPRNIWEKIAASLIKLLSVL